MAVAKPGMSIGRVCRFCTILRSKRPRTRESPLFLGRIVELLPTAHASLSADRPADGWLRAANESASYDVDPERAGSGGTLDSSAGTGPSTDSVTGDSTPGAGLRNERRRIRCCWRIRSRNCSCRSCWRSVLSRRSRNFRCCSLADERTSGLLVASLVGGMDHDVSRRVERIHRGTLRVLLRTCWR